MNALVDVIRREISDSGPISFARFMELALYEPHLGYYERQVERVGRDGDFFTSVSVGELFGELLASQFAEWLSEMNWFGAEFGEGLPVMGGKNQHVNEGSNLTGQFQIVEAGAHDGRLAADILAWFRKHRSDLFASLTYWIIEPSSQREAWQRETLSEFGERVCWASDWDALGPNGVCGLIFANELLDAFPVHRVAWDSAQTRWFECGVALKNDQFAWCRLPDAPKFANEHEPEDSAIPSRPAASERSLSIQLTETDSPSLTPRNSIAPSLTASAAAPQGIELSPDLLAALPDGFTTEVSLIAPAWWNQAALALKRGRLLTIDYGFSAEEFFTPDRAAGTLRGFYQHHLRADLLSNIGEQDLTSQVNFTEIQATGERAGLKTDALISQSKFLTDILGGIERSHRAFDNWTPTRIRQFQTLIHPEHLGRSFKVLIQSR